MTKTERFETSPAAVERNARWLFWEQAAQLTPAQQSWRRGINRVLALQGNCTAWAANGVTTTLASQVAGWARAGVQL